MLIKSFFHCLKVRFSNSILAQVKNMKNKKGEIEIGFRIVFLAYPV